jgi:CubicO group peptidase (beta-lactamase class C family)
MRIIHICCYLVALGASFVPYAAAGEFPAKVQEHISRVEQSLIPSVRIKGRGPSKLNERMEQLHVPGVSVAVIENYQIEWAKAYGLADAETGTSVTVDTLFQAGSVSKPVAALASLKLVEQGVLDLDRNVNDQLKSWKVPDNKFAKEHPVDLRGLLSHTAGLTVHGFPGYAVGTPIPTVPQILDGVKPANTQPVRVNKVPGYGFRYAGGGTTIAQMLLVDVTGRPFPELLRDTVLEPLGMTSSTYEQPLPTDWTSRASTGHTLRGKPILGRRHIYPEMAAAGLWTAPSDVARYVIEVERAHEGKSHKVLSHKIVEEMLTPQGGGPVGLGPFLSGKGNSRRFEHGGDDAGFVCRFVGFLDRGQGAMVMTNADSGGQLVDEVLGGIALAYDWPDYLSPERDIVKLEPKVTSALVGNYSLGFFGEVKVDRRKESLFASLATGAEFELFFESETKFFTPNPGITGHFVRNGQGQVTEVVVNVFGQEIHARKKKP